MAAVFVFSAICVVELGYADPALNTDQESDGEVQAPLVVNDDVDRAAEQEETVEINDPMERKKIGQKWAREGRYAEEIGRAHV